MLTNQDRCDQMCGATAVYLFANSTGGNLALCSHHAHVHGAALRAQGFMVVFSRAHELMDA